MLHLLTFLLSISVTFDRLEITGTTNEFWTSLGVALSDGLSPHWQSERSISYRGDFFSAFTTASCDLKIVLLFDEFSNLYEADDILKDEFLLALRVVRDSAADSAIQTMIAAGTFGILHLTTSKTSYSSFNVSHHFHNPNFTEDETSKLFQQFANDNKIILDQKIVKDIWLKSNGYVLPLTFFVATHSGVVMRAWSAFVDVSFPTILGRCAIVAQIVSLFKTGDGSFPYFTIPCSTTTRFVA